ncbi:MAG: type 4a pilus biogenesis protein PilO [Myxococcales bacterium]|nr:type 4a pilus biogenesis protein PilO [Myxococcales bacterium]
MAPRNPGGVLVRLSLPAKLAFGLVLLVVEAALYFIVFYADIDGQINESHSKEQELKGELQKAEEAKAAYQKDLEDKTRRQQQEREQKKVLPDEAETPAFLANVQGLATISGVTLASFTPQDEVLDEYFARVPMALTLSGRFHQIARFFFGVGQLDRVINIEDIQITLVPRKAESGDEVLLEVQCMATAFRAKKAGETKGKK